MQRPASNYLMEAARACGSQAALTGVILDDPRAMDRARGLLSRAGVLDIHRLSDQEVVEQLALLPDSRVGEAVARTVVSLTFDGSRLCWLENDAVVTCWNAVSGRSGYQDPRYQDQADRGPIPAGRWRVGQQGHQALPRRSALEALWNELGRGTWPGGESSWGRHRIWLEPLDGTDTHGRAGFSIHGGDEPGSAGCIDLTSNMGAFAERFLRHGEDVILTVAYMGR